VVTRRHRFSLEDPSFNGWGANVENWRFQSEPGISVAQLGQLELRWAFGTPGVVAMFGQPTIAGGRVFIAGQNGACVLSRHAVGLLLLGLHSEHRGANCDNDRLHRRSERRTVRRSSWTRLCRRRRHWRDDLEGHRRRCGCGPDHRFAGSFRGASVRTDLGRRQQRRRRSEISMLPGQGRDRCARCRDRQRVVEDVHGCRIAPTRKKRCRQPAIRTVGCFDLVVADD
jgi:hypothetical protein